MWLVAVRTLKQPHYFLLRGAFKRDTGEVIFKSVQLKTAYCSFISRAGKFSFLLKKNSGVLLVCVEQG